MASTESDSLDSRDQSPALSPSTSTGNLKTGTMTMTEAGDGNGSNNDGNGNGNGSGSGARRAGARGSVSGRLAQHAPKPPAGAPFASELIERFGSDTLEIKKNEGRRSEKSRRMVLELADGSCFEGYSFGKEKSVSGECVFQTGQVGYPESLTDPSYCGQILVLTYPLIGSYGVPSPYLLSNDPSQPLQPFHPPIPDHFESSRIHISALIVSSYSGQEGDYSHHLAESSLGKWLEKEGIPGVWGIDTREVVKRIREKGVMLGRVMGLKNRIKDGEGGGVGSGGDEIDVMEGTRGRVNGVVPRGLEATTAALSGTNGISPTSAAGKLRQQPLTESSSSKSSPSSSSSSNWRSFYEQIPFQDPNQTNLVAQVLSSSPHSKPVLYTPSSFSTSSNPITPLQHPDPSKKRPLRILAVDVGMKYNQIRCFMNRGVELRVVPWDSDFVGMQLKEGEEYDGLFLSNGPGDPTALMGSTVKRLRQAMGLSSFSNPPGVTANSALEDLSPPPKGFHKVPIFGICLGHQLLGLAAGAKSLKLPYGNRGQNIPCTSLHSGRCYITSQNHGYAVDVDSFPNDERSGGKWRELFVNANDGSNEGVWFDKDPFFSVQFHPESSPGPRDTEFLFDVFISSCLRSARQRFESKDPDGPLAPLEMPGGLVEENIKKNPRVEVKKVLVLGSGGLSIGQAGEFDYSGSQAIKALKEEGIYTILVNPNIATIQTSKGLADKVYFLPVNPEFVRKVIKHERPDGIYVTFGGQTALNVGIKMKDEFADLGVRVLGTPIDTIITTEDRHLFSSSMSEIGEKCAESFSATSLEVALKAAKDIGYPVICRAAFALGGLGSGFADNEEELKKLCGKAFANSPQVLIEKSMKGWKEIEYEVVRDCRDNCVTVCNMENFDPLGIHTGDSIVVAPSQTLSDADYHMLRTTAVNVIRHLGVVGECNIQYALNPDSKEYCIIEVNARLSRSSALASKATGYPLAFIAAKLGLGIPLNEIKNSVTKVTSACFEPSLDYVVVKIPRWDLKKFQRVSTELSSSMKSVGEVMSIGRTFEESIQKAIRSIDFSYAGFGKNNHVDDIDFELSHPSDKRLFAIANAFHEGRSVEDIWSVTNIDRWFLKKLQHITEVEQLLHGYHTSDVPIDLLRCAKQMGFSDSQISRLLGSNELAIRLLRLDYGITPFVKQIDTVAAEFPAFTNYLYMTYNATENDVLFDEQGVMVLGSGVYRIGSSVEFDWCAVRAVRRLRERNVSSIIINYNPETVSTDYDESDRLYFENISLEQVLDIYEQERSSGVIISMGGQAPQNICLQLYRQNVNVLGTSPEMIDVAENRYKFSRTLDRLGVDQPAWKELSTMEEAHQFCNRVGFPVLVRPSYVLSGAAMNVVYSEDDLSAYLTQAADVSRDHPVVITKYIEEAKEIEVDAIAKNGKLVMHYVCEHVENAGVHSGDATLVHPPQDLDPETVRRIEVATQKIGKALDVTGPFNIQFIAKNNEIKVIECNVRASRSFPFVSKVTGIDAIEIATDAILGFPIQPYPPASLPRDYVGVKVPQFSFSRLSGADPVLGVEMASTGEVACFGPDRYEAYLKALIASGVSLPRKNILLSIGSFKEKLELLPSVQKLHRLGFSLFATAGTADFIQEHGIPVQYLEDLPEGDQQLTQKAEYSLTQHIASNKIDLFINLPSKNRFRRPASYMSKGYRSRRMAVDFAVPLLTNVKCAKLAIEAISRRPTFDISTNDYKTSFRTIVLPGFVGTQISLLPHYLEVPSQITQAGNAMLAGGLTLAQISGGVVDRSKLETAQTAFDKLLRCDFSIVATGTSENAGKLNEQVSESTGALLLPFDDALSATGNKVTTVSTHFSSWPEDKPILTDARTTDLASVLLLASLHSRPLHVTNVQTKEDIILIALSKEKGLEITCDISIYSLFFSRDTYPGANCLPTPEDQRALWDNLNTVDVFSIGSLPSELASFLQKPHGAGSGIEEGIRLLINAVNDGRISTDHLRQRLVDNPRRIFDLPEQIDTHVEIELDRRTAFHPNKDFWSPLAGQVLSGSVHRVVIRGKTAFLDGEVLRDIPLGRDVSEPGIHARSEKKKALRFSTSSATRPQFTKPEMDSVKSPFLDARPPSASRADSMDIMTTSAPTQQALTPSAPLAPVNRFAASFVPTVVATPHPAFFRRHILTVRQFGKDDLHSLFNLASELRTQVERGTVLDVLRGRVLCTLFFEPSTRTSASFEAAMSRLGGSVVAVSPNQSSVTKGETLADTVRTLGCYGDALVVRHPAAGSVQTAAKFSPIPLINAGDGVGEHPTQALLDVYTIREELGTVNGLTVTLVGDLKHGRTVHSLVRLLCLYQVRLVFVAPPALGMPDQVKAEATKHKIPFYETTNLESVIPSSDVLYVTRFQQERFASVTEYDAVKDAYIVNNELLAKAKPHTIVMHPLPRNKEIEQEVDFDHRAAYFRQMRYGLFIRMALLSSILGA